MGRVIVFGMDGADPDLLFPWAQAGHLPNLARVMNGGAWGRLESTTHPLTPQAWTSMTTGVNPGRHGIFDFGMRRPGSYGIDLVTSRDRAFPTIFESLPEPLTCGVVNVPLSFPVGPMRTFAVGGMHTPTMQTPGAFYPENLAGDLDGYIIDVMAHWYDERGVFLRDVHRMHEMRHRTCLRLFEKYRPDIFFFVYVALDRVQHALWGEMTPRHRTQPGALGGPGDEIFRAARAMDEALGDWLALLGPDDHLLVVSDHGFGDLAGDVYLNTWLAEEGYLSFDPQKVRAARPVERGGEGDDPKHGWHRKLFAGPPEPLPASDDLIRRGLIDPRYKSWETVDWERTRVYSSGLFGNVWINLRGREPQGAVWSGRDYELLRDELIDKLARLRHPEDGQPLTSFAARREDLFWGPRLSSAPDLLVGFRDYQYMTRGATEFYGDRLVGEVVVGHTGNHRRHGIVALTGPYAARGRAQDSNITEIAPTILHLAGAPFPNNLDADVAARLIGEEAFKAHPPFEGPPTSARSTPPIAGAQTDMSEVLRRLQGLGYLV